MIAYMYRRVNNHDPEFDHIRERTPEQQLWAEALMQAMLCAARFVEGRFYVVYSETSSLYDAYNVRREVRWLASNDDHVGSFIWVCGVLGYDPQYIRNIPIIKQAIRERYNKWRCSANTRERCYTRNKLRMGATARPAA